MSNTPIGRVVATERNPTTTGNLRFWLAPEIDLKPFDFVKIIPPESTATEIGDFYAIIDEIFQVSDEMSPLSSFISSDFGDFRPTTESWPCCDDLCRCNRTLQHPRYRNARATWLKGLLAG